MEQLWSVLNSGLILSVGKASDWGEIQLRKGHCKPYRPTWKLSGIQIRHQE